MYSLPNLTNTPLSAYKSGADTCTRRSLHRPLPSTIPLDCRFPLPHCLSLEMKLIVLPYWLTVSAFRLDPPKNTELFLHFLTPSVPSTNKGK